MPKMPRSDIDYLIEFALAGKEAGAERFRYCDTLGYDSPFTIYERIAKIGKQPRCLLSSTVTMTWVW